MKIRIKDVDGAGPVNIGDGTGKHKPGDEYDSPVTPERADRLVADNVIELVIPAEEFSRENSGVKVVDPLDVLLGTSESEPVTAGASESEPVTAGAVIGGCGNCVLSEPLEGDETRVLCGRNGRKYKLAVQGCKRYFSAKA